MLTVYIDMDGVLCDFRGSLVPYINARVRETATYARAHDPVDWPDDVKRILKWAGCKDLDLVVPPTEYEQLDNSAGREMYMRFIERDSLFWAVLEPLKGSSGLISMVTAAGNPYYLLTSPLPHKACEDGKRAWALQRLGLAAPIIMDREKWRYAHPNALLIDDDPGQCEQFRDHGGLAVQWEGTLDNFREVGLLI